MAKNRHRKKMPPVLWVGFLALVAISAVEASFAVQGDNQILWLSVILNVVLLVGLALAQRWAYVLTIIFGILGVGIAVSKSVPYGTAMLFAQAFVIIPVLMAHRYFWGRR